MWIEFFEVCLECDLTFLSHPHDLTDLELDLLVVLKENDLTYFPILEWEVCLEFLEVCLEFFDVCLDLTPPNLEWEVWIEFLDVCLECDLTSHPHDFTPPILECEVWIEFFDVCLE